MNFRLLYTGMLLGASRTETRASHKHQIRKIFHPQLRRLWETNLNLDAYARLIGYDADTERWTGESEEQWKRHKEEGMTLLAEKWRRNGIRYIPLVTKELQLRCSIDILFLRPEEPGMLINSGDLDNRVKTLFDAFRIPSNASETGIVPPQEGDGPFYCLLEDDKLVSEIKVTTDQLLLLPGETAIGPNHAFAVINVTVLPTYHSTTTKHFI